MTVKPVKIEGLSLAIALFSAVALTCPTIAQQTVREYTSVSKQTIPTGYKEIIHQTSGKMEPLAVQMRESINPVTGQTNHIVEPLIMERRERLVQTTIIEPAVTETRVTKQQISTDRRTGLAYRDPSTSVTTNTRTILKTTDITREPSVQKTVIIPDPIPQSTSEPQVIYKKLEPAPAPVHSSVVGSD